MPPLLSAVVSLASVLIIGNLLILAHELGHYGAARALGVTARRFVIGFGPALAQHTDRRGTEWRLAPFPIGGYVTFPDEHDPSQQCGYAAQPPLARMAIIAAGPLTNLLVAFLVFAGLFAIQGRPAFLPITTDVVAHSAAEAAGFETGDRILTVQGEPVHVFDDIGPTLQASAGKTLRIEVSRSGHTVDLRPTLGSITLGDGRTVGFLGIQANKRTYVSVGFSDAVSTAASKTWGTITDTIHGISEAVTSGRGTQNFAGVLGIAQLAGQAAVAGGISILTLIAILSVNVALMNLLPIPVLDGGAFMFCGAEWLRGRPLSAKLQDFATRSGIAAMAALFMLSMMHDLAG